MGGHRYRNQLQALVKYRDIPEIPVNPYDIPASQAARLMQYDALVLSSDEEAAFQFAIENSDEKGPCDCMCWRWNVYSGLAKLLIHEHSFTGLEIVEVWNLSKRQRWRGSHARIATAMGRANEAGWKSS